LGDIVSPFVADFIKSVYSGKLIAILGNNDGEKFFLKKKFEANGFELKELKPVALELEGRKIIMMHEPIEIKSLCSHHFLPIIGNVYFEYIPESKVLGLSKIPRIIKWLARRPIIQELFTRQVVKTFLEILNEVKGIAVYVKAKHMCMTVRGVNESNAYMVTEAFYGLYEENEELRANFLRKIKE